MKVRAFKNESGGVSVIYPAPKSRRADESEEEWLTRVMSKATPDRAEFVDIDSSDVESDRTFRDAWKIDGLKVKVDMPKARAIHMNRIRKVRDKKLRELDVEYIRADESADVSSKKEISDKKKALRDLTETFDLSSINTADELKVAWPDELT